MQTSAGREFLQVSGNSDCVKTHRQIKFSPILVLRTEQTHGWISSWCHGLCSMSAAPSSVHNSDMMPHWAAAADSTASISSYQNPTFLISLDSVNRMLSTTNNMLSMVFTWWFYHYGFILAAYGPVVIMTAEENRTCNVLKRTRKTCFKNNKNHLHVYQLRIRLDKEKLQKTFTLCFCASSQNPQRWQIVFSQLEFCCSCKGTTDILHKWCSRFKRCSHRVCVCLTSLD